MEFLFSLVVLVLAAFARIVLPHRRAFVSALAATIVSLAGLNAYDTYTEVVGVPVEMTWEQMPDEFVVNFFRVEGEASIILWLQPDQLVVLPWVEEAEEALEGERGSMAEGNSSKFSKGGVEGGDGEQGEGDGEGSGQDGNGDGSEEGQESGGGGWQYNVQSRGAYVPSDSLPAKS